MPGSNQRGVSFKRLVVFGPMRSGNVLFGAMMGAQPGVVEARNVDYVMQLALRMNLRLSSTLSFSVHKLLCNAASYGESLPVAEYRPEMTLNDFHCDLLGRVRQEQESWITLRTHGPMNYLPELIEYDDVHCVLLIRDVRDVILSRINRGESDVDGYTEAWVSFVQEATAHRSHPRVSVLRFEDLVMRPAETAVSLSKRLGIDIHFPPDKDVAWPNHSSFGPLRNDLEPAAVARWRRNESRLTRYLSWRCQTALRQFDYEIGAPPLGKERWLFRRRKFMSRTRWSAIQLKQLLDRKYFPIMIES